MTVRVCLRVSVCVSVCLCVSLCASLCASFCGVVFYMGLATHKEEEEFSEKL